MRIILKKLWWFFTGLGLLSFVIIVGFVVVGLQEYFEERPAWVKTADLNESEAARPVYPLVTSSLPLVKPVVEPMEISRLSRSEFRHLTLNEYGEPTHRIRFRLQPVVYKGKPVSALQFSPLRDRVGFLYESSSRGIAEDQTLVILDIVARRWREVYQGSFRVGPWKWDGNNAVLIFESCGTHCLFASRRDASTGRELAQYDVYSIADARQGYPPTSSQPFNLNATAPGLVNAFLSPTGRYRGELYMFQNVRAEIDEDFYELRLTRFLDGQVALAYQGDFRTVNWKWVSDSSIKITYSCGQDCQQEQMVRVDQDLWRGIELR